jgi:hypothetical protein
MKITIFQQHTHAGVLYPAGTEIDLPEEDAQKVIDMEGARRAHIIEEIEAQKYDD